MFHYSLLRFIFVGCELRRTHMFGENSGIEVGTCKDGRYYQCAEAFKW